MADRIGDDDLTTAQRAVIAQLNDSAGALMRGLTEVVGRYGEPKLALAVIQPSVAEGASTESSAVNPAEGCYCYAHGGWFCCITPPWEER